MGLAIEIRGSNLLAKYNSVSDSIYYCQLDIFMPLCLKIGDKRLKEVVMAVCKVHEQES